MSVDTFVQLVREYVTTIDRASQSQPHELLSSCARLLSRIYSAGLDLPDVQPTDDDVDAEVASPMAKLTSLFGRYDNYFEVFDPFVDEKPVVGSLADDLADIYLDLARPLAAFDAGRTSDALWTWKFNLQGHCGDHLVDALRAIHRLVHDHMPPEYRAEEKGSNPLSDIQEITPQMKRAFDEAMLNIYKRAKAEAGYNATRFLSMVTERGGLDTARYLLHAATVSDGYIALWERNRLDLTVEATILDFQWQALFTEEERRIAIRRLREYGYKGKLPTLDGT